MELAPLLVELVRLLTDSMTWTTFADLQKYPALSGLNAAGVVLFKGLHPT